jgi:hypothetical protein
MSSDRTSDLSTPIACTLATDARPDRANAWTELLNTAIERESTASGLRLRFAADPQLVGTVADLVVREAECCAFFSFTLTVDARGVWLAIDAPPDARPLLDALFAAAEA